MVWHFLERKRGGTESGLDLVVVGIPLGLVGAIILVSSGPVGSGSGGVQSGQMGGLGVLDFRGLNRHSVVDHRDVLRSVPGSGSVPGVGSWGGMPGGGGGSSGMAGAGSGVSGKVLGLGVLNFGGVNWTGTNVATGGLVSGKVFGLGGGHLGGIGRHVVPVVGGGNAGQQQDGSDDESLHFE